MKSKPISDDTKAAILEAAWNLMAERGVEVGQAEIAKAAGVSRQTVFYAFGNRTGLLTAMLRHRDAVTGGAARLAEVRGAGPADPARLIAYTQAWLDYLPVVYPVGALLFSAGQTDPEARAALDDRMVAQLLRGFRSLTRDIETAGNLAPGITATQAAEVIWAAVHFPAWRLLVVERGWTPEAFRESRLALVHSLLRP